MQKKLHIHATQISWHYIQPNKACQSPINSHHPCALSSHCPRCHLGTRIIGRLSGSTHLLPHLMCRNAWSNKKPKTQNPVSVSNALPHPHQPREVNITYTVRQAIAVPKCSTFARNFPLQSSWYVAHQYPSEEKYGYIKSKYTIIVAANPAQANRSKETYMPGWIGLCDSNSTHTAISDHARVYPVWILHQNQSFVRS